MLFWLGVNKSKTLFFFPIRGKQIILFAKIWTTLEADFP
jgi:hypothetical protein